MKVYCRNCKYFVFGDSDGYGSVWDDHCKHNSCFRYTEKNNNTEAKGFYRMEDIDRVKNYGELNKNNNCKYYKRKWWKVWV